MKTVRCAFISDKSEVLFVVEAPTMKTVYESARFFGRDVAASSGDEIYVRLHYGNKVVGGMNLHYVDGKMQTEYIEPYE